MRRDLRFEDTDQLLAELDRLGSGPVRTTGLWSFSQILEHLRDGVYWALNRDPAAYRSNGPVIEAEAGRRFYERMVRSGKMRAGVDNPNAPRTREEGDHRLPLRELRVAIQELESYSGPFPVHTFFGVLSADEWRIWNRLHCAHHLSYAEQQDSSAVP